MSSRRTWALGLGAVFTVAFVAAGTMISGTARPSTADAAMGGIAFTAPASITFSPLVAPPTFIAPWAPGTEASLSGGPHFGPAAGICSPVDGNAKNRSGLDFGMPSVDLRVRAMADGVIEYLESADSGVGFGRFVVVAHGAPASGSPHFSTLYGHLASVSSGLAVGSTVKAGDIIGVTGSSGGAGGVHLHVNLYYVDSAGSVFAFPWDGISVDRYQFWPALVPGQASTIINYGGTATVGVTADVSVSAGSGDFCNKSPYFRAESLRVGSAQTYYAGYESRLVSNSVCTQPSSTSLGVGGGTTSSCGSGGGGSSGDVVVYDVSNLTGESRTLPVGWGGNLESVGFDNKICSLYIADPNVEFRTTEGRDRTGNPANFGGGRTWDFSGTSYCDSISWGEVVRHQPSGDVVLYDNSGSTGESRSLPVGWSGNLETISFDNKICSLYIADPNVEFRTTEGRDRTGNPANFGGGRTWDFSGTPYCDSISWGEVVRHQPRPTVSLTSTPAACVGPGPQLITWSGTNASEYRFRLNDNIWSDWSPATSAYLEPGVTRSNRVDVQARGAGGESDVASYTYDSDVTPPEIAVSQTGGVPGPRPPWFKAGTNSVSTGATITDVGCGASGLTKQLARDGGTPQAYDGTAIVITAEGKWMLQFIGRDGVGNTKVVDVPVWIDRQAPRPGVKLSSTATTTPTGKTIEVWEDITCDDTNRTNASIAVSGCAQWWYGTSQTGPLTLYTGPILVDRVFLPACSSWSKTYSVAPWMRGEDVASNLSSVMTASTTTTVSSNTQLNCGSTSTPTAPGCKLTASSTALTMTGTSSLTVTVKVYSVGGFTGTVNLAASGAPTGVTATLGSTSAVATSTGTSVPLTIGAANPPRGLTGNLVISGTSGSTTCTPATITIKTG